MKIQNNKIVEITEAELFDLYLKREIDYVMPFDEYKQQFAASGTIVTEEEENHAD